MSEDANTPKRNWRGQFVKRMRETPPEAHVWLIWSKKRGLWHRRSSDGGACGYTSDITQAGFFPYAKAASYNDGWDDTVFHVSEKMADIQREIRRMEAGLAEFKRAATTAALEDDPA